MFLIGNVVKIMDEQSGESANGKWRKREFVLETEGKFPKKVCVQMRGDIIDSFKYSTGDKVKCSIDIESREYQGRFYTDVRAWKIEAATAENSNFTNEATPPSSDDFDRDMPF